MENCKRVIIIRASHANEFELQNYAPLQAKCDIQVITSQQPLTKITLPTTKLWSLTDLPNFPFRRQLFNRLFGGEQWLLGIREIIKRSNGSIHRTIVNSAETYTPYTHQAVQLKKAGAIHKLVCTCWETIPHNNEKVTRLRSWKKEAYQYVDLFHSPTKRAKQALIEEGVPAKKIRVIPYGVDLARFRPAKGQEQPIKRVLTVARLEKEKGVAIIETLANLYPKLKFVVVGQGSYHFHPPNIRVKTVPYSKIHKEYQQADLFLFPSQTTSTWEEQYGMALIEALATGLPIIAANSGAIGEVVAEAGILVSSHDPFAYRQALAKLLDSPQLVSSLKKSAVTRAKNHFDHHRQAATLSKLYNSS